MKTPSKKIFFPKRGHKQVLGCVRLAGFYFIFIFTFPTLTLPARIPRTRPKIAEGMKNSHQPLQANSPNAPRPPCSHLEPTTALQPPAALVSPWASNVTCKIREVSVCERLSPEIKRSLSLHCDTSRTCVPAPASPDGSSARATSPGPARRGLPPGGRWEPRPVRPRRQDAGHRHPGRSCASA